MRSPSSTHLRIFLVACLLSFLLPADVDSLGLSSKRFGRSIRVKKSSGAHGYLTAAKELDNRAETVLYQLRAAIPSATKSVEKDIRVANRDRAIIGISNFLGSLFGVLLATSGNQNLGQVPVGDQIQVVAELLYGYGYWGPFLLEFEDAILDCNEYDLDAALSEFSFLTDMQHNYGYLDSYSGSNPRSHLSDVTDPLILQFYAVELNHAIKRNLYCITSRKGGNQSALELNTMIDLYTQLLTDRLTMTNEAIDEYSRK